jgi:hypothetical protein
MATNESLQPSSYFGLFWSAKVRMHTARQNSPDWNAEAFGAVVRSSVRAATVLRMFLEVVAVT